MKKAACILALICMLFVSGCSYSETYEEVSITGEEGTISLKIPDGWKSEVYPEGSAELINVEFGIHVYPESVAKGFIEIGYQNSFGVCGTGLKQEEMQLAGVTARVGTYDEQDYWTFIVFGEGKIVAYSNLVDTWFNEYEDQILEILDALEYMLFTENSSDDLE